MKNMCKKWASRLRSFYTGNLKIKAFLSPPYLLPHLLVGATILLPLFSSLFFYFSSLFFLCRFFRRFSSTNKISNGNSVLFTICIWAYNKILLLFSFVIVPLCFFPIATKKKTFLRLFILSLYLSIYSTLYPFSCCFAYAPRAQQKNNHMCTII